MVNKDELQLFISTINYSTNFPFFFHLKIQTFFRFTPDKKQILIKITFFLVKDDDN